MSAHPVGAAVGDIWSTLPAPGHTALYHLSNELDRRLCLGKTIRCVPLLDVRHRDEVRPPGYRDRYHPLRDLVSRTIC